MSLPIITVDQRLAERRGIKAAIFGKPGIGKTSLLWTLMSSASPPTCRGIADGIILHVGAIWILPERWVMACGGWDGRVSGLLFRGGGPALWERPAA